MADSKVGTAQAGSAVVGGGASNAIPSDIKVSLTLSKSVGKSGFGIPLILAGGQTKAVPYTECVDIDEVRTICGADSPVTTAAALMFKQSNERFKVAVCAATDKAAVAVPKLLSNGWRQLVVPTEGTESDSTITEISDVIETSDREYFATVHDLASAPSKTIPGMVDGKEAQVPRDRTIGFSYPAAGVYAAAALVGAIAQKTPGTYTCKNLILKGIDPLLLDDETVKSIHDTGCITFVTKAGDNVTTEGKTIGGEYIDIVDGKDYIIWRIQNDSQKILNQSSKVPFNDNGIAQLEAACVGVMKDCYGDGNLIIETNDDGKPAYFVHYGSRAETNAADRANRHYALGHFSFRLLGAIHTAEINGSIVI